MRLAGYIIVYSCFAIITLLICTPSMYSQGKMESRSGINYGFEVFEYHAVINPTYTSVCTAPIDKSLFKVPVFDIFYVTYNGVLAIGGAAGIRWGRMDEYYKVQQVNLDLFLGLGTGYFDIYIGGRGRVWYELQQKAFNLRSAKKEFVTMNDSTISLSYAALVGIRIYIMRVFTVSIELTRNYFDTEKYNSYDHPNIVPAFTGVSLAPIGFKVSLGLNLFE